MTAWRLHLVHTRAHETYMQMRMRLHISAHSAVQSCVRFDTTLWTLCVSTVVTFGVTFVTVSDLSRFAEIDQLCTHHFTIGRWQVQFVPNVCSSSTSTVMHVWISSVARWDKHTQWYTVQTTVNTKYSHTAYRTSQRKALQSKHLTIAKQHYSNTEIQVREDTLCSITLWQAHTHTAV